MLVSISDVQRLLYPIHVSLYAIRNFFKNIAILVTAVSCKKDGRDNNELNGHNINMKQQLMWSMCLNLFLL